jgi:hypothetical protein
VRSLLAGLRTLVLPWGAGPNDPALIMGPTIPPELAAYYLTRGGGLAGTVVSVIKFQATPTDYLYQALVTTTATSAPYMSFGRVDNDTSLIAVLADWARSGSNGFVVIGDIDPAGTQSTVRLIAGDAMVRVAPSTVQLLGDDTLIETTDVTRFGETWVGAGTWTPVLKQGGANVNTGFATQIGRYRKIGLWVDFYWRMTVDNAALVGAGTYNISLPFDLGFDTQSAIGVAVDASTGARPVITADLDSAGAGTMDLRIAATGAVVTQAAPFAVANGDQYSINGCYIADA